VGGPRPLRPELPSSAQGRRACPGAASPGCGAPPLPGTGQATWIPSFRARSCRAVLDPAEQAMAAVCTIPPPPTACKGALGLPVVQLDLGSCSFQHFVLLDDVCAALKRPAKSWSDGTKLYELCTANNLHVNKAR
jgi:hypothetical protein